MNLTKLFKKHVLGIEANEPINLSHLLLGGARLHGLGDAMDADKPEKGTPVTAPKPKEDHTNSSLIIAI